MSIYYITHTIEEAKHIPEIVKLLGTERFSSMFGVCNIETSYDDLA